MPTSAWISLVAREAVDGAARATGVVQAVMDVPVNAVADASMRVQNVQFMAILRPRRARTAASDGLIDVATARLKRTWRNRGRPAVGSSLGARGLAVAPRGRPTDPGPPRPHRQLSPRDREIPSSGAMR